MGEGPGGGWGVWLFTHFTRSRSRTTEDPRVPKCRDGTRRVSPLRQTSRATKHEAPLGVRRGVGGGGGGSRIDAGATAAAGGGRNAGAMRMSGYSVTSVRQSIALLV